MRSRRTPACPRRALVAALLAPAPLLALAGCSDASPPAEADPGAAAGHDVPSFAGVQHELPSGAALDNAPDLYEHVALTGCEATDDGWRALGTAENTSEAELTFSVLVVFTDAQARIVDSASAQVTVAPSDAGEWTAERTFEAPAGTSCVVRAVNQAK